MKRTMRYEQLKKETEKFLIKAIALILSALSLIVGVWFVGGFQKLNIETRILYEIWMFLSYFVLKDLLLSIYKLKRIAEKMEVRNK